MNLSDRVGAARARVTQVLQLPPLAAPVLDELTRLELDPEFAASCRAEDGWGREGVLGWSLLARGPAGPLDELEAAVARLEDWGIIQVIGSESEDPVVPGPAALRLSAAGRACLGLLPTRRVPVPEQPVSPWVVLHGASRESLLLTAAEALGEIGLRPLEAAGWGRGARELRGRVTESLCTRGGVVVDGFGASSGLLSDLLTRTPLAAGLRILAVPEPTPVRLAAILAGARLLWIEPQGTRRAGAWIDSRVSERLQGARPSDRAGVPDSELAVPRRASTPFEALCLPDRVQLRLQEAVSYARYRLAHPEGRAGYRLLLAGQPGTGKSMAAEALATALDAPLLRMDLSMVLSKWLGETEKLLAQVFDVAEASGSVLVLDEAESLLRQRGGNESSGALSTGVTYLLTRLDRFGGVLVATTNRAKDLDEAFYRRFDDFVVLPLPDEVTRHRLWRQYLGDAAAAVDIPLVAAASVAGALIQGSSSRAAAWASALCRPLDTPMVLASLCREMEKNDRSSLNVELGAHRREVQILLEGRETRKGGGEWDGA